MTGKFVWMAIAVGAAIIGVLLLTDMRIAHAQEDDASQETAGCSAPEHAQFDFWVGEWELTWEGGSGENRIERILGGCVIQESFSGQMPTGMFLGRSVSVYDAKGKQWRQTWVDNTSSYLTFVGGMEGERMVLRGQGNQPGTSTRMTFYNIEEDSLDWDWEISPDGGETWNLAWRIHYQRE